MTIRSNVAKAGPYIANGMTAVYPFTFKALDPSHVRVEHDGPIFSYEVRLLEEGGEVVFSAPVPEGTRITILRDVPVSQETDFQNNTAFYPEVIETALDKIVMICQQYKEELARCVKIAATSGQKPEDIIAMILGAKDIALTAAEGAANANASASAAALTVQTIWAEITGNDASAQEALEALKQAFEAAGSVEAAAAAGRESVNAASLAAVEYANQQINESKDASVEVISATTQNRKAELLALISETLGAEGAVSAAVKTAEDAAASAKESAESIDAATQEALASVNAAVGVADQKRLEAQAAAAEAKTQAEQTGEAAAEAYGYIAQTLANKDASAKSAQDAAQSAASAQIAADAAAGAAGEAAETAAQRSITAHNNSTASHPDKLSLSGGTVIGVIRLKNDGRIVADLRDLYIVHASGDTNNRSVICAGDAYETGASVYMHGKDHPANPGIFNINANNGTEISTLTGKPDGTLTWRGKNITKEGDCLSLSGGTMTGSIKIPEYLELVKGSSSKSRLILRGGTEYAGGATLALSGKDANDIPGGFALYAHNGTNTCMMMGTPDGNLIWGGHTISCVVKTWQSQYSWYKKYADGWVEQGGVVELNSANTWQAVTLHVAMKNAYYHATGTNCGSSTEALGVKVHNAGKNTTTTLYVLCAAKGSSIRWYVCGYWK